MKRITRRQFLAVMGAAAAVSALSACGSSSTAASTAASSAACRETCQMVRQKGQPFIGCPCCIPWDEKTFPGKGLFPY